MNSLDELFNSLFDFLQLLGAPKNQNKTEEEEKMASRWNFIKLELRSQALAEEATSFKAKVCD